MALSSVDNIVAAYAASQNFKFTWSKQTGGVAYTANKVYDTFTLNGAPTAGSFPGTAYTAAALSDASAGAIPHGGNVAPATKHLVAIDAWSPTATGLGWLILVDMLAYYPGINMNDSSLYTFDNTVVLPRYTSGLGVRAFFEVTSTLGAAGICTCNYTNTEGVSERDMSATTPASMIAPSLANAGLLALGYGCGLFSPLRGKGADPISGGDVGIRHVNDIRQTAMGGGTTALVLCRPLAQVMVTTQYVPGSKNLLLNPPRIYDGACLSLLFHAAGATTAYAKLEATLDFVWG